jgi:hypothetical protein
MTRLAETVRLHRLLRPAPGNVIAACGGASAECASSGDPDKIAEERIFKSAKYLLRRLHVGNSVLQISI